MKTNYFCFTSYIFVLLLIGSTNDIFAQIQTANISLQTEAEEAIHELKAGVLIVRLPSYRKKIAAMQELMQDKTVSKSNKENLKKQITLVQQDAHLRNLSIVEGFQSVYDFSEVLFIYDHHTKAVQEGNTAGIFLNERLKIDESIQLNNRPYLFARFGKTDTNTTTGLEGIIITDRNLQDLTKPFPAYVRESSLMFLMDKTFDKTNADKRNMPRLVEKLNKKLKKYSASLQG